MAAAIYEITANEHKDAKWWEKIENDKNYGNTTKDF